MAKSDSTDGDNLPPDSGFSTRGSLWIVQSGQAFGGFGAKQYREGQGRLSMGEFRQFLGIARGSNYELQTQLVLARSLGFGNSVLIDEAESLSHEVGKMIYALLESLKESASHGQLTTEN
jgi:hypothetical protein